MNIELINDLLKLFYEANEKFLKENLENFEMGVSERNLCSCLAMKISELLPDYSLFGYYSDVEYNRNGLEVKTFINNVGKVIDITCDLIVHSRGKKEKDNLIAVEMKKLPCTNKALNSDRERLMCLTKENEGDVFRFGDIDFPVHVCEFEIGIYYIINERKRTISIELYSLGKLINIEEEKYDYWMNYSKY